MSLPLRDRILALDAEITTLDQTIANREATLNALTYRLYYLTPEEIAWSRAGDFQKIEFAIATEPEH